MKRSIAFLLIFVLMLSGCGTSGVQEESTPGAAAEETEITLWGKKLSVEKIPVPQEAFDAGGAELCTGMAPDGVTFLMTKGVIPYLYDSESKAKMTLLPADETTCEVIRTMLVESIGDNGTLSALEGEQLTEALCKAQTGELQGPRAVYSSFHTDGNYMIGFVSAFVILIDCETGSYYIEDPSWNVTSVYGGKALIKSNPSPGAVSILDLASGEVTVEDFSAAGGFEEGASVTACMFLPDGSLCAVLRDNHFDRETGEDVVLAVRDTNGSDTVYSLGRFEAMRHPDLLFSVGSDYIIASSQSAGQILHPYMIDRKNGTVSVLSINDFKIEAQPLDTLPQENGFPVLSNSGASPVVLEAMADGETALIWGFDSSILLYKPSTGETQGLVPDEYNSWPAPIIFCGNGYDRFWMNPWNDFTDYTQITVTSWF